MTGPVNSNPNTYSSTKLGKRRAGGIFLRLGSYVLRQWYLFIPAVLMTLLSNQLALLGPKYSGEAIDAITRKSGVDLGTVKSNVLAMVICYTVSAILAYVLAVIMVHLSQRIIKRMRKEVFEKLTGAPLTRECHMFLSKYAHDGMSSGQICGEFWIDKALPLLLDRLNSFRGY